MMEVYRYRIATCFAIVGVITSVIYRLAPGEATWMDPSDVPLWEQLLPPVIIDDDKVRFSIQNERFTGGDGSTILVGRLYQSLAATSPAPVVVMAHGLGLTQDCRLQPFIDAFTEDGIAVFTFDYATFGWSEGWPRHQVYPRRHVADLQAAITHIRQNRNKHKIDTTRIALWGTSLGGGHVLSLAAMDPEIKAVVANVPHIRSGLEGIIGTIQRQPWKASIGLVKVLAALFKGLLVALERTFSHNTYNTLYIPLHGQPGSAAMMQNKGDDEGYGRLVQHLPSILRWKNLASVWSVLPVLFYRPLNTVSQIQCPTLLIAAEFDTLCPASDSEAAARLMDPQKTQLITMEGLTHFDIYNGKPLERVISATLTFLKTELQHSV